MLQQFEICGRPLPSESTPTPEIFRMKIFAPNDMVAKSRFWYFMKRLQKLKRANGEILSVVEVPNKAEDTVKNYGMWIRWRSRTGIHNSWREYRSNTVTSAVEKMYSEMAGQHRVRWGNIQIISVDEIEAENIRRNHITEVMGENVKFPLPFAFQHAKKVIQTGSRYQARRPSMAL
ncbi:60S ribosomal protein L18a/ L20, eukaryotes [Kipferlia bialata]|uniref:60S ribosomal protein L18a n=1 Tax=Kipferlia bialata TaxID=797122 RepID=A0A391NMJ0_9EUKA|nr:60S ribosomal protein L18a/ L20, eukaryotes [Kipferlia bialata]|eukprot:g6721.t1